MINASPSYGLIGRADINGICILLRTETDQLQTLVLYLLPELSDRFLILIIYAKVRLRSPQLYIFHSYFLYGVKKIFKRPGYIVIIADSNLGLMNGSHNLLPFRLSADCLVFVLSLSYCFSCNYRSGFLVLLFGI